MNYYQNFFEEIKEEYKKNNIEFKWNWTEAQNKFNSNQTYQVLEKQDNYSCFFEDNCFLIAEDSSIEEPTKYHVKWICKNNDELISYMVFYLSSKIKIPELFHYKMITSIKNNSWLDCYLGKSKSKAL